MKVALLGNPNVGKTTLFNTLTGSHQEVANWPGTTIEYTAGKIKPRFTAEDIELIDLPGTYALTAYSQEERVTRNYLLYQHPDVVIVVVDASNLERNLYLALEVMEFTNQVVLALNMTDVAADNGISIDVDGLSRELSIPVITTIARKSAGLTELLQCVTQIAKRRLLPMPTKIPYPKDLRRNMISPVTTALSNAGLTNSGLSNAGLASHFSPEWAALRLLQGDDEIIREVWVSHEGAPAVNLALSCCAQHAGLQVDVGNNALNLDSDLMEAVAAEQEELELQISDAKYAFINDVMKRTVSRRADGQEDITTRLDKVLLHTFWGYPIMALIFFVGFYLSFVASAPLSAWVTGVISGFGAVVGHWLTAHGAAAWVKSLILDGVFAGVGAVLSFVPYMAIFFAIYQMLQDSGYMARASVLIDRLMQLVGLHGKGFFAMVSAYGCNVPAMTATRVMENPRDRLLANLVIPFIPCNARLGVMAVMTAAFFPGTAGAFAMIGLLLISLAVVAGTTSLLRKTILPTDRAPLVMELPHYHVPSLSNIILPTANRVWMFVSRIWVFLLWATLLTWALIYFPVGQPVEHSFAGTFGHWLESVGQVYGFDWRLMIAIIFGFVAKETTLSTLGVLYGVGSAAGASLPNLLAHSMTPLVAFTYLVVYMLYVPCLSTVVQMHRETGSWKWTVIGMVMNIVIAFGLGLLVEQIGFMMGFAV